MTAVYVPVSEPLLSGAWFWLSLVMVPMVMALIKYEHKPKLRRLLAAGVLALTFAVVMAADDDVVIPESCTACQWVEPGSWFEWYCKWVLWC